MSSPHFAAYLNRIAKVPLLTHKQEIELGTIIQDKKDSLDPQDIAQVSEASKDLVNANLRLVVKAASKYRHTPLDIEELTFEGNQGLIEAVERFNPKKFRNRFSTYATWWIQQSLRIAVNNGHTIRTPVRRASLIAKIQSTIAYDPDLEEQDTAQIANETNIPEADIKKLLRNRTLLLRLDAPVAGNQNDTVQFVLPSEAPSVDFVLLKEELSLLLVNALTQLEPRECEILYRRFGLLDSNQQTLEQIAEDLHITRERVRQIQQHGLMRLQQILQQNGIPIKTSALLPDRKQYYKPKQKNQQIPHI